MGMMNLHLGVEFCRLFFVGNFCWYQREQGVSLPVSFDDTLCSGYFFFFSLTSFFFLVFFFGVFFVTARFSVTSFCEDGLLTCAGLLGCVAIHVQLMVEKNSCALNLYIYIY